LINHMGCISRPDLTIYLMQNSEAGVYRGLGLRILGNAREVAHRIIVYTQNKKQHAQDTQHKLC
jgi:hypothetical protein